MINKYNEHFLLDIEEVKAYVVEVLHYFAPEEKLEAIEIGDGNINYVFKVYNPATGNTIIIKQADKYLRSSGRPLDVYRNKIEAEILMQEGILASAYVPKVFAYDETMCILAMEDISAYDNLRKELLLGHTYHHFANNIAKFLAATLLPTTDLVMNRAEKKDKVKLYTNKELCDISEDLVLTEPYDDYKQRNIISDENKAFVTEFLYEHDALKTEAALLRNKFMNHAQALIHGDLHTGSIFINQEGIKIIDPEFAFYGPMGYDIGNVIGNLFFAWANRLYLDSNNCEFLIWIEQTIAQVYDQTKKELSNMYDMQVKERLYCLTSFKQAYIQEIMADAAGYAGTEIIRRVVGDSKVLELTEINDSAIRIKVERVLIKIGIYLIMNRSLIMDGKTICEQFKLLTY